MYYRRIPRERRIYKVELNEGLHSLAMLLRYVGNSEIDDEGMA